MTHETYRTLADICVVTALHWELEGYHALAALQRAKAAAYQRQADALQWPDLGYCRAPCKKIPVRK